MRSVATKIRSESCIRSDGVDIADFAACEQRKVAEVGLEQSLIHQHDGNTPIRGKETNDVSAHRQNQIVRLLRRLTRPWRTGDHGVRMVGRQDDGHR